MVIESNGIKIGKYYIPPFKLEEGEIVLIYLFGGSHYFDLKMELVSIFTSEKKIDNVNIIKPLTFANYFFEPPIRKLLYPVSVSEYLKKNSDMNKEIASKIYEISYINEKTKVNSLAGKARKLLNIYATLSKSNNIIFDLDGLDPYSSDEIYNIVKENIKNEGSAILIDWSDHFKTICSKCITVEIEKD